MKTKLANIICKTDRRTIGTMSGTSLDGLDIALCDVNTTKNKLSNIKSITYQYPSDIRASIFNIIESVEIKLSELSLLSYRLGLFQTECINRFLNDYSFSSDEIDLIGIHGQTIFHGCNVEEYLGTNCRATMQIGEAEIIAKNLGIITISDFRQADLAVGGSGAPLTPYYHAIRFKEIAKNVAVVNIGGIANITFLSGKEILATDSGPGNCIVDYFVKKLFNKEYDQDGQIAKSGKIDEKLLTRLKELSFFKQQLPVSYDRKTLIDAISKILEEKDTCKTANVDLITTLSEFTIWSIYHTIARLTEDQQLKKMLICGGSVHNQYFMDRLKVWFKNSSVETTTAFGSNPDFLEAEAFAYYANLTLDGKSANLASVTGAGKQVILGKISQP